MNLSPDALNGIQAVLPKGLSYASIARAFAEVAVSRQFQRDVPWRMPTGADHVHTRDDFVPWLHPDQPVADGEGVKRFQHLHLVVRVRPE
jgi:hypothetical protein